MRRETEPQLRGSHHIVDTGSEVGDLSNGEAAEGFAAAHTLPHAPGWMVPAFKFALVCLDALLAASCLLAAFYLREGEPILVQPEASDAVFRWSRAFAPYSAVLLFAVPIRVLTLAYYSLYRLRGEFSFFDDSVRLFKATAIGSLLLVATAFLFRGGFAYREFSYSRGVFVLDFFIALVLFGALRLLVRKIQKGLRRRNLNLVPTLVVGRNAEARMCVREMRARPELGYRVVGVIENRIVGKVSEQEFEGAPVVGSLEELPNAIRTYGAREVIITDSTLPHDQLFNVMMQVGRRRSVEFRLVPTLFNSLPRKTALNSIGALPMVSLFREPLSRSARVVKRASDLIIAFFALLLLAPVWALIALLIKLDTKGPVLYRQERVGMDGRLFLCLKFRTMRHNADAAAHREHQRLNIAGRLSADAKGGELIYGKVWRDERITKVGRLLRRLSLDELPQLLNVLRGEMSVVGPRPPIPYEVEFYESWHRRRLDMKPGITGLWQVSGRNRLSFDEMVRLDLFYIENWSLRLDFKILLQTLPVMLRGDAH